MLRNFSARVRQIRAARAGGVLLAANLIAAGILLFPPGGSAEDLEKQLAEFAVAGDYQEGFAREDSAACGGGGVGTGRGRQFLGQYFLGRRAAPEALLAELGNAAAGSKIKEKGTGAGRLIRSTAPIR